MLDKSENKISVQNKDLFSVMFWDTDFCILQTSPYSKGWVYAKFRLIN